MIALPTLLVPFLHYRMAAALQLVGLCLENRVVEADCPRGADHRYRVLHSPCSTNDKNRHHCRI